MRFKPGQEVVCIHRGGWIPIDGSPMSGTPPKYNEIYTIKSYDAPVDGCNYVYLFETDPEDSWFEDAFEPIVSDAILESELATIENHEWHAVEL